MFWKDNINVLLVFSYHFSVFENKDKIVIVMEYACKGELYDYISERRRLSERETRRFFRQIVSAVHHCHKVRKHSSLLFYGEKTNILCSIKFFLCHTHLGVFYCDINHATYMITDS